MACIIASTSSNSGKTFLSILLASWGQTIGRKIQTFKVGPDYLDSQHLSAITNIPCRNLDLILCKKDWVENNFNKYSSIADFVLVEGVMGLFDGIGNTESGSTADVAKHLGLPIVLTVDSQGQAASLAPLVKGFRDHDTEIEIAGVVVNNVNSSRHKDLLEDVLSRINIKLLGCLPRKSLLSITNKNLGLTPPHEIDNMPKLIQEWADMAKNNLDLRKFESLMQAPRESKLILKDNIYLNKRLDKKRNYPIAIAKDKAFHFHYPETTEVLEQMGMPILEWRPTEDETIPSEAKGLIIPGGFPEEYAKELSTCKNTFKSLNDSYGKIPIYAECGGMLLLGEKLRDENNIDYSMAGILPINAKKGSLKIGYRELICNQKNLIAKKGDKIIAHEFHRWNLTTDIEERLRINSSNLIKKPILNRAWTARGWRCNAKKEGWSTRFILASWMHLHWASNRNILNNWANSVIRITARN